jgi:hypothetical protein
MLVCLSDKSGMSAKSSAADALHSMLGAIKGYLTVDRPYCAHVSAGNHLSPSRISGKTKKIQTLSDIKFTLHGTQRSEFSCYWATLRQ